MNPWSRFQRLLQTDSPVIAQVVAVHNDGQATVETQAGNQFRVDGQPSAAQIWVQVQGGKVVRELGNLDFLDLDV